MDWQASHHQGFEADDTYEHHDEPVTDHHSWDDGNHEDEGTWADEDERERDVGSDPGDFQETTHQGLFEFDDDPFDRDMAAKACFHTGLSYSLREPWIISAGSVNML